MNASVGTFSQRLRCFVLAFGFVLLTALPAMAGEYDNALKGVQSFDAIYEVSQGDPKVANIVFVALKDSYKTAAVQALPGDPRIAVVFHGPAVKLLSTDRRSFNAAETEEVEKFQKTLGELKKDGVKLEICLYAADVFGVDKSTIIPAIDKVANGFVSVIGYQMQGYAVVRVP